MISSVVACGISGLSGSAGAQAALHLGRLELVAAARRTGSSTSSGRGARAVQRERRAARRSPAAGRSGRRCR